jgi:uncharacterized C2H2 Zn-finger protein
MDFMLKTILLQIFIMTVHQKRRDFQCDHCDKAFGEKGKLNNHINGTHKEIKRFCCDLCDYSSYRRSHMEQHSKSVHLENKDFKCDHCDKAFSQKQNLTMHINTRSRDTGVMCVTSQQFSIQTMSILRRRTSSVTTVTRHSHKKLILLFIQKMSILARKFGSVTTVTRLSHRKELM